MSTFNLTARKNIHGILIRVLLIIARCEYKIVIGLQIEYSFSSYKRREFEKEYFLNG